MSGHKFFSGLPEHMMAKTIHVPDRLKSNFYWPDDSNREQSKRRSTFNHSQLQSPVSPSNSDIYSEFEEASLATKDRKSKLLKSNIEFYDMVDTTNDSMADLNGSRTSKNNTPMHKKLQLQTSKIEFYDYVDLKKPSANGHANKTSSFNADAELRKKSAEDDVIKPLNGDCEQKTEEVEAKKISENGRQTCDEQKIEQMNGSMKNINLKSTNNDDDSGEEVFLKRQQKSRTKDLNERQTTNSRHRDEPEYSDEEYENGYRYERGRYYEDERDYYSPTRRPYSRRPPASSVYDEDEDEICYAARQRTPRYEQYRRPGPPPRRIPIPLEDEYDYDYHPREVRKPPASRQNSSQRKPSPIEEPYYEDSPTTRQRHMDEVNNEFDRLSAIRMNRTSPSPKLTNNNYITDCEYYRQPNNRLSRSVSICSSIGSTNESKARAHRHLKSNVFHNNDEVYYDESNSTRPRTVRESAAHNRVGVGLPDIH